jgi:hypothetical protein
MLGGNLGDSFWGVMLIEVTCVGPGAVVDAGRLVHRFKLGLSSCEGIRV